MREGMEKVTTCKAIDIELLSWVGVTFQPPASQSSCARLSLDVYLHMSLRTALASTTICFTVLRCLPDVTVLRSLKRSIPFLLP